MILLSLGAGSARVRLVREEGGVPGKCQFLDLLLEQAKSSLHHLSLRQVLEVFEF